MQMIDEKMVSPRRFVFAAALALVLCAVCVGGVSGADGWDGTADTSWYKSNEDTFTITTAEQLAGLASLVNAGNTFSGKRVILGNDIVLNPDLSLGEENLLEWGSIGTAASPFAGTFDGMGYTISGLYQRISRNGEIGGLFGVVSGMITGVTLANSKMIVDGRNVTLGSLVGVLKEDGGNVNNCKVTETVEIISDYEDFDWGTLLDYFLSLKWWKVGEMIESTFGSYTIGGVVGQNDGVVTSDVSAAVIDKNLQNTYFGNCQYGAVVGSGNTVAPGVTTYTITATCGDYGNISSPGEVLYEKGKSVTYYFTPDSNYVVADVIVDGEVKQSGPEVDSYTFDSLSADHTIQVTFRALPVYNIDPDPLTISNETNKGASVFSVSKIYPGYHVKVTISSVNFAGDSFQLIHQDDPQYIIPYTLIQGSTPLTNKAVITFNSNTSVTLTAEVTEEPTVAGEYSDILTFTFEEVKDTA